MLKRAKMKVVSGSHYEQTFTINDNLVVLYWNLPTYRIDLS